ncbi:MAG: hypothetical protein AAFQ87_21010 [Bacteroidota bacterium]
MAEATQDPIALPRALVFFLWLGVALAVFTLADVLLPRQAKIATVLEVNIRQDKRMGEEPIPMMDVALNTGHFFSVEYETVSNLSGGDQVYVATSLLIGKVVQYRLQEGGIIQRIWGLYTGLMWVPMLLLISALLSWRRKDDAPKAIPYLIPFIFSLMGTVVLMVFPGW